MSVAGGSILASSVMYKSLSCHVSVQQQFINSIYLKKHNILVIMNVNSMVYCMFDYSAFL